MGDKTGPSSTYSGSQAFVVQVERVTVTFLLPVDGGNYSPFTVSAYADGI